jgi:hypothetical protein
MNEKKKVGKNTSSQPVQKQPLREERGNFRGDSVGKATTHFMVKPPEPPTDPDKKKKG